MQDSETLIVTIFGGIIALAIISVIVGKNSKAPQAIQSFGSALANIVGAAVSPANTATNGNLGNNPWSGQGAFVSPNINMDMGGFNFGFSK